MSVREILFFYSFAQEVGMRILIIDPDTFFKEELARKLAKIPFVTGVKFGIQFKESLKPINDELPYDFIFTNLEDGVKENFFTHCEKIKPFATKVKIFVYSNEGTSQLHQECARRSHFGVDDKCHPKDATLLANLLTLT